MNGFMKFLLAFKTIHGWRHRMVGARLLKSKRHLFSPDPFQSRLALALSSKSPHAPDPSNAKTGTRVRDPPSNTSRDGFPRHGNPSIHAYQSSMNSNKLHCFMAFVSDGRSLASNGYGACALVTQVKPVQRDTLWSRTATENIPCTQRPFTNLQVVVINPSTITTVLDR
jgi:hypothetical protein